MSDFARGGGCGSSVSHNHLMYLGVCDIANGLGCYLNKICKCSLWSKVLLDSWIYFFRIRGNSSANMSLVHFQVEFLRRLFTAVIRSDLLSRGTTEYSSIISGNIEHLPIIHGLPCQIGLHSATTTSLIGYINLMKLRRSEWHLKNKQKPPSFHQWNKETLDT